MRGATARGGAIRAALVTTLLVACGGENRNETASTPADATGDTGAPDAPAGSDSAEAFGTTSAVQPGAATAIHVESLRAIRVVRELRLGSASDPEIGFSRVIGVDVARSGEVLVLDWQDRKVKVYDGRGSYLHAIGRAGQGPGEFQGPSDFGLVGDTLWVRDGRAARITLFDLAGEVLSTVPAGGVEVSAGAAPGAKVRIRPDRLRPDGSFTSSASVGIDVVPLLPDSFTIPNLIFGPGGEVADTAGVHVMRPPETEGSSALVPGVGIFGFENPLNTRPMGGRFADDTIVIRRPAADSGGEAELTATRLSSRGDVLYHTVLSYEPTAVPPAFRDSVSRASVRGVEGAVRDGYAPESHLTQARAAIDAMLSPVRFFPPVDRHHVGTDGAVWLRLWTAGDAPHRWVVLDPGGNPLGYVELAADAWVAWSSGDLAWVVEPDEVAVPWVVRYRLGRP